MNITNKMKTGLLVAVGLLAGGAGAATLAVHAQQTATPVTTLQTTPAATTSTDVATPSDTDNVQDANGVEVPDAAASPDTEVQDDANEAPGTEANDDANGHQDPAGANVDNQSQGVN